MGDLMLRQLNYLPDGILDLAATELYQTLHGPTLIHLPGRHSQPIFVSVLLHGNEHTSWEALRRVLRKYEDQVLPRAMSIFIGNVKAAKFNLRFIDGQQDFNRIWGTSDEPPASLMQHVITEMKKRDVFMSIDIHNNTGKNPHYACINVIDDRFLYLAHLFSRTMVYFIKPEGVQSMAFAKLCPAATVECGLSGEETGTQHVMEFIEACLHLSEFPNRPFDRRAVNVFHTVAICKVPPQYSVGFGEPQCDVNFHPEIEFWNFRQLSPGLPLAEVSTGIDDPINVVNEHGEDVTDQYLTVKDGCLLTTHQCIPAMITRDLNAIRKDCFCYLMEEYPL